MKTFFIYLFCFFCSASFAASNTNPDEILGIWLTANKTGHVEIYKVGKKYFGKLIWMKEPNGPNGNPKKDINNPNKSLQSHQLLGAILLSNLSYDDGEWSGGHIYDPQNGKEYKCYLKLKDPKTLNLRGYIGFSLLGRTEVWARIK